MLLLRGSRCGRMPLRTRCAGRLDWGRELAAAGAVRAQTPSKCGSILTVYWANPRVFTPSHAALMPCTSSVFRMCRPSRLDCGRELAAAGAVRAQTPSRYFWLQGLAQ